MSGPLTRVGTKLAAVQLDVSRKLNWGKNLSLEFIVVDRNEVDNWNVVLSLTKGFDRISDEERTDKDGSSIVLEVADLTGTLVSTLRLSKLFLRIDDAIYRVAEISPVAPNEPQVFTIYCKERTLRTSFDTTK